jgi:hypothetical protein
MFHYTKITTYEAPKENKMENEKKNDLASLEALHNLLMDLEQKLEEYSRVGYLHSLTVTAKPFLNDFDRGQLYACLQHELRVAERSVFQAKIHIAHILKEASKLS